MSKFYFVVKDKIMDNVFRDTINLLLADFYLINKCENIEIAKNYQPGVEIVLKFNRDISFFIKKTCKDLCKYIKIKIVKVNINNNLFPYMNKCYYDAQEDKFISVPSKSMKNITKKVIPSLAELDDTKKVLIVPDNFYIKLDRNINIYIDINLLLIDKKIIENQDVFTIINISDNIGYLKSMEENIGGERESPYTSPIKNYGKNGSFDF